MGPTWDVGHEKCRWVSRAQNASEETRAYLGEVDGLESELS